MQIPFYTPFSNYKNGAQNVMFVDNVVHAVLIQLMCTWWPNKK